MKESAAMKRLRAPLTARRQVAEHLVELEFAAPELAVAVRPGQFVMVGPLQETSLDPFLARPFSVYRVGDGKLRLLVAVVGRGTALLAGLEPGHCSLGLLGPLGKGFTVPAQVRRLLLVGGGLGLAPLVFLAERQLERGLDVHLVVGARRAAAMPDLAWLAARGVRIEAATEDGSRGFQGTVVELVGELARREQLASSQDLYLAACGPEAMLRSLHQMTSDWPALLEVSLENRMACGVGACLGCARPSGGGGNVRVCREGPVFAAAEVFS